jgi:hypothetical protein
MGHRRLRGIGAGTRSHHIAGIVDDVPVVAETARHAVCAEPAVEDVVGAVAGDIGCRLPGGVSSRD